MLGYLLRSSRRALFCLALFGPQLLWAQSLPAIFVSDQQATLAAERSGLLLKLPVTPGDKVKKGDVLAVFDTSELNRELATSRAQRNFLLDEIKATERLTQQGMANAGDLARLKKDADIALANILWLKQQTQRATLKAPFNGTVIDTQSNAHEWMQAGQPVLKLLAEDQLTLLTSAPEALAVSLRVGDKFPVHLVALNQTVEAILAAVLPQVDVQSSTVTLRLKPMLNEALAPQVFAGMKAVIQLDEAQ